MDFCIEALARTSEKYETKKRGKKRKENKRIASVGMKILMGVALTSTVCIGGLVYAFWQANEKVAANVNEVLAIRQQDSAQLRAIIVAIQDKMLSFTQYLKVNPENEIRGWLDSNFQLIKTVNREGRDSWKTLFDRTQRRDLTKHRAVVLVDGTTFSVSFGVFGEDGAFADSIESQIYSLPGGTDIAAIKTQVDGIISEASEGDALKNNLAKLGAVIADEALKAELTRTEILNFTEIIDNLEKELLETKQQNKRFILGVSGIVCFINLLVIFFLTRVIVERPLRSLIGAIDQLGSGELHEISTAIENALVKQQHDTETIAQLVIGTSQDTRDVSEHIQQVRQDAARAKSISARVSEDAEVISRQLTGLLSDATTRLQDIGQLEKAA